jgi:hypothetical protein
MGTDERAGGEFLNRRKRREQSGIGDRIYGVNRIGRGEAAGVLTFFFLFRRFCASHEPEKE